MAGSSLLAARAAQAPAAANEAASACEDAARRALSGDPGRAGETTFSAKTSVQMRLSTEQQIVLSGEGRWRDSSGVRSVQFTCNVDRQSLETVGFMIRDAEPAINKAQVSTKPPTEPDMSTLSVASCESSAALALKRRWPRVSQISFDPETRTFQQKSLERAALLGEGRALPAQGKPVTYFGFECQIDPHDGRVVRTLVTG